MFSSLRNIPDTADLPANWAQLPNRMWPFFWHFVRQDWAAWLLILLMQITYSIIDATLPLALKRGVSAIEHGQSADIFLRAMGLLAFLTLVVLPLVSYAVDIAFARLRPAFSNKVRYQLFSYVLGQPLAYFEQDFSGRISSKVMETPSAISQALSVLTRDVSWSVMMVGTTLVLLMQVHWAFGVAISLFLLSYVVMFKYFLPHLLRNSTRAFDALSVLRGQSVDAFSNILSVKLFARNSHEQGRFHGVMQDVTQRFRLMNSTGARLFAVLEFLFGGLFAGCAFVSYLGYKDGWLDAAALTLVWTLLLRSRGALFFLTHISQMLFENLGQIEEGMQALAVSRGVQDASSAHVLESRHPSIQFENVSFQYASRPVFDGLTLDIPAGQKVGLLGVSGAGKSTLTKLLLRLYDIHGGRILVDGQDIAQCTQDSLRAHIAVIPQMPELLHRSIRENIAYGALDADENAIRAAAEAAQADVFIDGLVDHKGNRGYDALVGERGVKLSGGQRQRIALARAILKNAPILVLDEATASLDTESERAVQAGLEHLMQGRTVIAIAHRLSTIAHLDRLIVMDNGRIVEDGTHAELLAKGGMYAKLWGLQSGNFLVH